MRAYEDPRHLLRFLAPDGDLVVLYMRPCKAGEVGARACERRMAEISDKAIEEKAADDALQAENVRLCRFLAERNTHTEAGRNCIERRDADGLRDDYDAIFGERLSTGRSLDGAE